ncbi:MAG: ATP-dependent RNA helicase HrpA, partial [Acidimicrobiia bacterium]|nr:ATP-dependent RNA helicase HrpA [Acidimicrobiia bacterium]
PVEVRYRPVVDPDDPDADPDRDQIDAIGDAVAELQRQGDADILVFLPGEREIRDTADALAKREFRNTEVLPLYARLSTADQHRVFQPPSAVGRKGRRIVLATNVAETSLTVPGIRSVVDPGTARISRYNRRTKVQRLPIEPISQASADQRAGRCGRVAPGVCIRLYAEDDYVARPRFTEPEVLRTSLASVILQMTAIGLGDVAQFPFVEPPDARSIADGMALLEELGALTPERRGAEDGAPGRPDRRALTPVGRRLARLPIDPRLGRMVLEADANGCVAEVMVIAAALSIQDPRERPAEKQQAAAEAHARFAVPGSDFLPFVKLWEHLRDERQARTSSAFRRMCRTEFLNHLRVREWQDVHGQLRVVARSLGIRANAQPAEADAVHRSLLAGLLSHIGMRHDQTSTSARSQARSAELLGARQARFAIAPGSALFKSTPPWVMVAELVETNRLWGRVGASISPRWAEELGAHLVKRSYDEPWWDAERGSSMVHERVTLYGLPVVAGRRVQYGRIDPSAARDLFLWHALVVEGGSPVQWTRTGPHEFLRRNAERIEEVRELEERARRRDILLPEEARFAFYHARVPASVTSTRHFDRWWRDERHRRPDRLDLSLDDLVDPAAGDVSADALPRSWRQGDLTLPLTYVFDPTSDLDGVTVDIPLALLDRVEPTGFDWLVPGWREELVVALIRSLPKVLRRSFVPAGDHARALLETASPADGALDDALARHLQGRTGEVVPPGSWQLDRVPDHLRMTFRVVSERGRALAWSKDLRALQTHLRGKLRSAVAGATRSIERTGLTTWAVDTLPRRVETEVGGYPVTAYPALVDEGTSVGVRTFPDRAAQGLSMWEGTRRLLLLSVGSPVATVQRQSTNAVRLALASSPYATSAEVLDDCVVAALDSLLADAGGPVWDEEAFGELSRVVGKGLGDATLDVARRAGAILAGARRIEARSAAMNADVLQPALDDVALQVARLVGPGFVAAAGVGHLVGIERYLRAVEHRLDRLPTSWPRDRVLMERVQQVEQGYDHLRTSRSGAEVTELRWLLEELRVSLFAQTIGTAQPVSEKRVRQELERLRAL